MECPVCSVEPGRWHRPDCGWEQCPYCGGHLVGCCCKRPPLDDRIRWAGFCPWVEACEQFGFFETKVHGRWVQCGADELRALSDILILIQECALDRVSQR